MKTTATNKKIHELMTGLRTGSLIPRPYFQRRLVWTARHKQLFIRTVLEGYPFPEIFLCDGDVDLQTGVGQQLVVDGQQRITTLHQYFTASEDLRRGDLPAYRDLDDPDKQSFLDYDVVVRDLGRLTDPEVREVFHRMNSTNYSLNTMEVNNARFDGALKRFAEDVSKWDIFEEHRLFTQPDIRRMGDIRWSLTLVISLIAGYFNRDAEHEAYLRRYNDEFPEQDLVRSTLSATCDLIGRIQLGARSRAWQKTDLLTLIVEVYRNDPTLVIVEDALGEALRSFYAAVDAYGEGTKPESWEQEAIAYYNAVISGSNERARRIRRGTAIRRVIDPHFLTLQDSVAPDDL